MLYVYIKIVLLFLFSITKADQNSVIAKVGNQIIYTNDEIVAAYKKSNIWGLQFHPEKSNLCGYNIIKSILSTYAEEN